VSSWSLAEFRHNFHRRFRRRQGSAIAVSGALVFGLATAHGLLDKRRGPRTGPMPPFPISIFQEKCNPVVPSENAVKSMKHFQETLRPRGNSISPCFRSGVAAVVRTNAREGAGHYRRLSMRVRSLGSASSMHQARPLVEQNRVDIVGFQTARPGAVQTARSSLTPSSSVSIARYPGRDPAWRQPVSPYKGIYPEIEYDQRAAMV